MSKLVLRLDAWKLQAFQHCPQEYCLNYVLGLRPMVKPKNMGMGTLWSTAMAIHYRQKMRGFGPPWFKKIFDYARDNYPTDYRMFCKNLTRYMARYEKEPFVPISVERPIVKVISEDENHLFVYVTKPDLIARYPEGKIIPIDHKVRAYGYKIHPFNNQVLGYLWVTGSDTFMFNYMTLKDSSEALSRELVTISPDRIEEWRQETVKCYWRIVKSLEDADYPRTYQCQGKFGVCTYSPICEAPGNLRLQIIQQRFEKSERAIK